MSPRPKNSRKVLEPPKFKGYKPFGYYGADQSPILLLYEEYAALRLSDYELMTQEQAAGIMEISRPTFTRLYEHARRKIAQALAEARPIEVEKGDAYFDHEWYHCSSCGIFFNHPTEKFKKDFCPLCHSLEIYCVSGKNEQHSS